MRAIVYGIGKGYLKFFAEKEFIKKEIVGNEIEIAGFSDNNKALWGKEIIYENQKFIVQNIKEFKEREIDKIIVTTKLYFEEIKEGLIKGGYEKESILLIDQLFKEYLDKIYMIDRIIGKAGIEIGGPTELFYNIYDKCSSCDNVNFSIDTVWIENDTGKFIYKNKDLGCNWIADATDMYQIENKVYDFLLSSNNLEHIANPLKALEEFSRIVKIKGVVIVLVPKKEACFDHDREYTSFEHLLDDYKKNIQEDDLSHLPEIVEKHDYSMDIACGGKENFIKRAKKNIENRCLHHHVFDEDCLRKAFSYVGLEVIDFASLLNNWLIIGEKRKA